MSLNFYLTWHAMSFVLYQTWHAMSFVLLDKARLVFIFNETWRAMSLLVAQSNLVNHSLCFKAGAKVQLFFIPTNFFSTFFELFYHRFLPILLVKDLL
jgi:hypothetical protein